MDLLKDYDMEVKYHPRKVNAVAEDLRTKFTSSIALASDEKMDEINPEEDPQTPFKPVLSIPSDETLTSAEPRKKR